MDNKRIHYIIIPVLIILLLIYSYQRVVSNKEVISKSDKSVYNSLVEIGNCYSYEERGIHYGVVLIKYEDDDLFRVALLDKASKEELKITDFRDGAFLCTRNEMLTPSGASGLHTGFFFKNDLKVFQQNFKYIGKVDLDISKLEVNGGSTLIDNQKVSLMSLHNLNLKELSKIKIIVYKMPVVKFIEEY